MKFTNEQIKSFLLFTEIFDVLRTGQVMNLDSLNIDESKEVEYNKKFQRIAMNLIVANILEDDEKEFIFKIISASMNQNYDNNFEATFYSSLENGGFFDFIKNADQEQRLRREEAIFQKWTEFSSDDMDDIFSDVFENELEDDLFEEEKGERVEKSYHDNGQLAQEIPYNENNNPDGEAKVYHYNGNIYQIVTYVNGSIEGIVYMYTKEGDLETQIDYKDNKVHGAERGYFRDGTLEYETKYNHGVKTEGTQYYHNGNVQATIEYDENGERHGWLKQYYEDGTLKAEGKFEHGQTVFATLKEYNEDGSTKPTKTRV